MCAIKKTFVVALNTVLLSPELATVIAVNEHEALGQVLSGRTLDDIRGAAVVEVVDTLQCCPDHVIIDHLKAGRKITAIKAVREATKWGLKEAKDYVDTVQQKHNLY